MIDPQYLEIEFMGAAGLGPILSCCPLFACDQFRLRDLYSRCSVGQVTDVDLCSISEPGVSCKVMNVAVRPLLRWMDSRMEVRLTVGTYLVEKQTPGPSSTVRWIWRPASQIRWFQLWRIVHAVMLAHLDGAAKPIPVIVFNEVSVSLARLCAIASLSLDGDIYSASILFDKAQDSTAF